MRSMMTTKMQSNVKCLISRKHDLTSIYFGHTDLYDVDLGATETMILDMSRLSILASLQPKSQVDP